MKLLDKKQPENLVGLGFRPEYFKQMEKGHSFISWIELLTENYLDALPGTLKNLRKISESYDVVFHGVSLSIGGIHDLDWVYLEKIKKLRNILKPRILSDHLAFTRYGCLNSHDLLPMIYTEETLTYVAERVDKVQDFFKERFYLENPSAYIAFAGSQIPEQEFFAALCSRTGCGMILDVNNLIVNQSNLNLNPQTYLKALHKDVIGYCHIAGHSIGSQVRIDTHGAAVCNEVWELLKKVIEHFGPLPTMIERDQNLPDFAEMERESLIVQDILLNTSYKLENDQQNHDGFSEPREGLIAQRPTQTTAAKSWQSLAQTLFDGITCRDRESLHGLKKIILDKVPTPPSVGLGVYYDGYRERLVGVLSEQMPTFTAVSGKENLRRLVEIFLKDKPLTSYSVDLSLVHFGDFIDKISKQAKELFLPHSEVEADAFVELAKLEQSLYHQIFQQGDPEPTLDSQTLIDLLQKITIDELFNLQFRIFDTVKIMKLEYDLLSVIRTYKKTGFTTLPQKKSVYAVIFKQDGITTSKRIPKWQAEFLDHLKNSKQLGEALKKSRLDSSNMIPKALHCIGYWCQMGIFVNIEKTVTKEKSDSLRNSSKTVTLLSPELSP